MVASSHIKSMHRHIGQRIKEDQGRALSIFYFYPQVSIETDDCMHQMICLLE